MSGWTKVAKLADVAEGAAVPVEAGGRQLALYNLGGGEMRCTANVCTHAFALLTDGWLEEGVIECPLHGGRFDVRTGKGLCAPIEEDIATFPVRAEGEDILVELP